MLKNQISSSINSHPLEKKKKKSIESIDSFETLGRTEISNSSFHRFTEDYRDREKNVRVNRRRALFIRRFEGPSPIRHRGWIAEIMQIQPPSRYPFWGSFSLPIAV